MIAVKNGYSNITTLYVFVFIVVFRKEKWSEITYRIVALKVSSSREKSHIMYVI